MAPELTTETIESKTDGAVKTLTFARPDCLNAISDVFTKELHAHLKATNRDESIRCLVLTGKGRGFSAGQDLDELKTKYIPGHIPSLGADLRKRYNPIVSLMRSMPIPIIGAINGVAAGAGCSIALACDLRIASNKASFIEIFVNVGLVPDSGSTWTLPRLIGWGRAIELCMTGRKVDAEEALQIGLVTKIVKEEKLSESAMEIAQKLSSMPTKALALTKRLFEESFFNSIDVQLEKEAFAQETAGRTKDHFEGVTAFLEKRPPAFEGI